MQQLQLPRWVRELKDRCNLKVQEYIFLDLKIVASMDPSFAAASILRFSIRFPQNLQTGLGLRPTDQIERVSRVGLL